jgi:hypothetical protein
MFDDDVDVNFNFESLSTGRGQPHKRRASPT